MVYAFKLAGAAAEAGADLDGVTRVAQKAADAVRTIGAALTSCTVPAAGRPTFTIAEDEMEMCMGIHGEPGVWRGKLRPADAVAPNTTLCRAAADVCDAVESCDGVATACPADALQPFGEGASS